MAFQKKPLLTTEQYAATRPPAPCGNQTEHYFWRELQGEGWPCPVCAAKAARKRKEEEEDRVAKKIADLVVSQMNSHERLSQTRGVVDYKLGFKPPNNFWWGKPPTRT